MAEQLEISQRQYSRIEKQETDISLSKIEAISKIFEISFEQLMGFDEKFIFKNCETALGGINQNYYAFSEKEREQYEKRIAHLESEIVFLRSQLESRT